MELEKLPAKTENSLDEQWFSRYSKFAAFESYAYLAGEKEHRAKEKENFLAGKTENPTLDYPKLDPEHLESTEQQLLSLKKDVLSQEENAVVAQLYRWRINEKIAEVRMLKAAMNGEGHSFRMYSEFVYGRPSEQVFAYTMNSVQSFTENFLDHDDEEVQKVAQDLNELLPKNLPSVNIASLPEKETFEATKKITTDELGNVIQLSSEFDAETLNAEQIKAAFETALQTLRLPGWEVIVDKTGKTAVSVVQEDKKVIVPEGKKLSVKRLNEMILHEIGTHVARRENGERSKLQLLGLGLDRYEKGEEGIATMRQQILGDEVKGFSGFAGHFAISLAYGLDGKKRNFREVFEILEKYYTLLKVKSGKDLEESKRLGQNISWNRCVRTFRGSTCEEPGVCYTKDIIYREGNIDVWKVLGESPEKSMSFNVGKYDPANPRHLLVLSMLGIIDADLDTLEKND